MSPYQQDPFHAYHSLAPSDKEKKLYKSRRALKRAQMEFKIFGDSHQRRINLMGALEEAKQIVSFYEREQRLHSDMRNSWINSPFFGRAPQLTSFYSMYTDY